MSHIPVMINEVLQTLAPQASEVIVDGTFGRGGYSRAILKAADCKVLGIDRDPSAVEAGKVLEKESGDRFEMIQGEFGRMKDLLLGRGLSKVDAIVLDIGVSSPQLDEAERGFSFAKDGPLDMRMSQDGPTAADLVNSLSEEDLANVIYQYGEEKKSRRIASRIVERRKEARIETTKQLASIIYSVMPKPPKGIDPATRTFQALRIKVNDELGELEKALRQAEEMLVEGGRLVVVTFHSLEDRIVKQFLKSRSQPSGDSGYRHLPNLPAADVAPSFQLKQKKALTASEQETSQNPRSRSAKLRWAVRTSAPALED